MTLLKVSCRGNFFHNILKITATFFYTLRDKVVGYLMAGTLAGWPGQVVRVRAVSRAGEPSRAQVTLGAGRPEVGGSVEKYVLELLMIFRKSFHNIQHSASSKYCEKSAKSR